MIGRGREARLEAIRRIVGAERPESQEELREWLARDGIRVSQSTLSRDIHRLGLSKRAAPDGSAYYAIGDPAAGEAYALSALLPQLLTRVDGARNLLVLRTLTGSAQPVAAALDAADWPDVVGTLAGDDTVLVVARSEGAVPAITARIRELAGAL